MSDLGTRIHALVEWTAPPIDGYEITRGRAPRPARWVPILAAFVAVLVIGGFTFVFGGWQPGDPVADATSIPVDVTDPVVADDPVVTTTHGEEPIRQLTPVRVDCTAELEAFPCVALIDGDLGTEWQTAARDAIGSTVTFYFAAPVELTGVSFTNIRDHDRFLRNARIARVSIRTDEPSELVVGELADSNDQSQVVPVSIGETIAVTIVVEQGYPGQSVGDREPFEEFALAEVEFFGRGPAGEHFDPESALIIGIMESALVPELYNCPSSPDLGGTVDGDSFLTPTLALEDFVGSFDDLPRIAIAGYVELGQSDGSIIYGKPLNDSDLDRGYVTLVTVRPQAANQWAVTSWEGSGC